MAREAVVATDNAMCAQLIELWETYLLQLDSDEDGPPLMPVGVQVDSGKTADAQAVSGQGAEGTEGREIVEGSKTVAEGQESEDTARPGGDED